MSVILLAGALALFTPLAVLLASIGSTFQIFAGLGS